MSDITMDQLSININTSADNAISGLTKLQSTLEKLQSVSTKKLGLEGVINEMEKVSKAGSSIDSNGLLRIKHLVNTINTLSNLKGGKISSSIGNQLGNIANAVNKFDGVNAKGLGEISEGIGKLSTIPNLKNVNSSVRSLEKLPGILKAFETSGLGKFKSNISELSSAMNTLQSIGKNNLNSNLNAIAKIPKTFEQLEDLDLSNFENTIKRVSNALEPLANNMNKIGSSFQRFPANLNKVQNRTNGASSSGYTLNDRINQSLDRYIGIQAMIGMVKRGISVLAQAVDKSNQYIEDMNLFNASMGEFAREAQIYGERVSEILGLDPGEWLKSQGVFMTLASGFGVASDRANTMSKNLTQLGYDISSFFNISVQDAMLKLQSGLSGELEPLRRIGYDLSEARLKAEALALGITKTYKEMTQAEKAQLRYHAILTQVTVAQGDMARSLQAPSNQIRIMQSQFAQLGRAVGNIVIPVLNQVLPYVIAIVRGLRVLLDHLGKLMGFKLPEIDYSGIKTPIQDVATGIGDIDDSVGGISDSIGDLGGSASKASKAGKALGKDTASGLDEAKKKAEKLRATILSFDELHILNEQPTNEDTPGNIGSNPASGSGGSGSPSSGGAGSKGKGGSAGNADMGGWKDFDLVEYDFLSGLVEGNLARIQEKVDKFFTWLKDNLEVISAIVSGIGSGVLAWNLLSKFPKLDEFLSGLGLKGGILRKSIGIGLVVTGISLSWDTGKRIAFEGLTLENIIRAGASAIIAGLGTATLFGFTPLGFGIGFGLSLIVTGVSYLVHRNLKIQAEDLEKRFGNINLTDAQINKWADNITATIAVKRARLVMAKNAEVLISQEAIQDAIGRLDSNMMSIVLGIEVSKEEVMGNLEDLITNSRTYLENTYLELKLSFAGYETTETGAMALNFLDEMFRTTREEFEKKAVEVKEAFAKAWTDNGWNIDTLKEAQKLQNELFEITQVLREMEYKIKLNEAGMILEYDTSIIDFESFQKLQTKLNETLDTNLDALRHEAANRKVTIELMYDQKIKEDPTNKQALEAEKAEKLREIDEWFDDGKIEMITEISKFTINRLEEGWGDELNKVKPILEQTASETYKYLNPNVNADLARKDVSDFIQGINDSYDHAFKFNNIDGNVKENMKKILKEAEPSLEEMQKVAEANIKAGKTIDESLLKGLLDAELMKRIAGVPADTSYMLLQSIHQDPNRAEILKELQNDGSEQSKALLQAYMATFAQYDDEVLKSVEESGGNTSKSYGKGVQDKFKEFLASYNFTGMFTELSKLVDLETLGISDDIESNGKLLAEKFNHTGFRAEFLENINSGNIDGLIQLLAREIGDSSKAQEAGVTKAGEGLSKAFAELGYLDEMGEFVRSGEIDRSIMKAQQRVSDSARNQHTALTNSGKTMGNKVGQGLKDGVNSSLSNSAITDVLKPVRNRISSWWSSNAPTLKLSVGVQNATLKRSSYGIKTELYATGGFPNQGQMFIAREAGPELVGSIGGRTAVANNDQIVSSVARGVAQAVSGVINNGGNGDIVINIKNPNEVTGKEIYRQNISKARREGVRV